MRGWDLDGQAQGRGGQCLPGVEGLAIGWVIPAGRPPWGRLFLTLRAEATSLSPSVALYSCHPGACRPSRPLWRKGEGEPEGQQVASPAPSPLPSLFCQGRGKRFGEFAWLCGGLAGLLTSTSNPSRAWRGVLEPTSKISQVTKGIIAVAKLEIQGWIQGPHRPCLESVSCTLTSAFLWVGVLSGGLSPRWGKCVPSRGLYVPWA